LRALIVGCMARDVAAVGAVAPLCQQHPAAVHDVLLACLEAHTKAGTGTGDSPMRTQRAAMVTCVAAVRQENSAVLAQRGARGTDKRRLKLAEDTEAVCKVRGCGGRVGTAVGGEGTGIPGAALQAP